MKYLLNVSVDITTHDWINDSFRGEGRWERNILAAFLQENKQVHTTRKVWSALADIDAMPLNLYDGLNEEWLPESVLFVHSAGSKLYIERDDAKAYITQFHEPITGAAKQEFLTYLKEKRIVATVASYSQNIFVPMAKIIGKENIYQLAGPMVPYVIDNTDNFRKPYVTWSYRNFTLFMEQSPNEIKELLDFLDYYMRQEPEMRIVIIVGLWDMLQFGTRPDPQLVREWILNFPVMQNFKHLHERIDIRISLQWNEVLDILKDTRYIISPAEFLGSPPYEAAMFGIPTIVNKFINPFITLKGDNLFPEVLTSDKSINFFFLSTLEKLQTDHAFYTKHGNAYRKYTKENATFSSYIKQIDNIIHKRGWNK